MELWDIYDSDKKQTGLLRNFPKQSAFSHNSHAYPPYRRRQQKNPHFQLCLAVKPVIGEEQRRAAFFGFAFQHTRCFVGQISRAVKPVKQMHTHRRYLLPDSALKRLTQRRDKRMNSFPRRYLRKPLFSERLIHCRIGIGDVKIKRQPDKTEFPDAREHFEEKQ